MVHVLNGLLSDPPKETIKDDLRNGSPSQKATELFEGLNWRTILYKTNPKFSSSTSLPLYFYLGYQILQENEEFMKECGKVSSFIFFLILKCPEFQGKTFFYITLKE